jgi:hypothetical protein
MATEELSWLERCSPGQLRRTILRARRRAEQIRARRAIRVSRVKKRVDRQLRQIQTNVTQEDSLSKK